MQNLIILTQIKMEKFLNTINSDNHLYELYMGSTPDAQEAAQGLFHAYQGILGGNIEDFNAFLNELCNSIDDRFSQSDRKLLKILCQYIITIIRQIRYEYGNNNQVQVNRDAANIAIITGNAVTSQNQNNGMQVMNMLMQDRREQRESQERMYRDQLQSGETMHQASLNAWSSEQWIQFTQLMIISLLVSTGGTFGVDYSLQVRHFITGGFQLAGYWLQNPMGFCLNGNITEQVNSPSIWNWMTGTENVEFIQERNDHTFCNVMDWLGGTVGAVGTGFDQLTKGMLIVIFCVLFLMTTCAQLYVRGRNRRPIPEPPMIQLANTVMPDMTPEIRALLPTLLPTPSTRDAEQNYRFPQRLNISVSESSPRFSPQFSPLFSPGGLNRRRVSAPQQRRSTSPDDKQYDDEKYPDIGR